MQFAWDDGDRGKCLKHGLTHAEIEYALAHGARVAPDPAHSGPEERFIAVSRTAEGRPVFVAFCWRGENNRHISARYLHARETARYDKANDSSPPDD